MTAVRLASTVLGLALCAVPFGANAEEGWQLEEHRPSTWDDDLDTLRDAGLGQSRGAPVVLDDLQVPVRPVHDTAEPTVLFLNFDGVELVSGPDDARSNVTTISNMAGSYPAYGSNGAKRQAILQSVADG